MAFAAARTVELEEAHRLVTAAGRGPQTPGSRFVGALLESDGLGLSAEQIDTQLDPSVGLEPAVAMVDRVWGPTREGPPSIEGSGERTLVLSNAIGTTTALWD